MLLGARLRILAVILAIKDFCCVKIFDEPEPPSREITIYYSVLGGTGCFK